MDAGSGAGIGYPALILNPTIRRSTSRSLHSTTCAGTGHAYTNSSDPATNDSSPPSPRPNAIFTASSYVLAAAETPK